MAKRKHRVDHTKHGPLPDDYFDNYDKHDKKMNPYRGWESDL